MSRILLDTSALSAFFRGHPDIVETTRIADRIAVNPVVLAELNVGFHGGSRLAKNRELLAAFLQSPRVRNVILDAETAERYAQIYRHLRRAGTPIPTNNIWIAASAMQFGLLLVSTDAHFAYVPQIALALSSPDPGRELQGQTGRA